MEIYCLGESENKDTTLSLTEHRLQFTMGITNPQRKYYTVAFFGIWKEMCLEKISNKYESLIWMESSTWRFILYSNGYSVLMQCMFAYIFANLIAVDQIEEHDFFKQLLTTLSEFFAMCLIHFCSCWQFHVISYVIFDSFSAHMHLCLDWRYFPHPR